MSPHHHIPVDGAASPEAKEAADAAVRKVFAILGVDLDNPSQVEEFRRDLRFAGDLRRDVAKGKTVLFMAAVGVLVTAIGLGVQQMFQGHK